MLQSLPVSLHPGFGRQAIVFADTARRPALIDIKREIQLVATLATLGRDDDNATGCTVTVEGCGGSIFQHGHRGDIVRVEV